MLYLIGLGLNEKGISQEGLEAIKKCKKIYLENYTVDFPYSKEKLEKIIKKKVIAAERDFVESDNPIKEAKKEDVALLIYGSPLTATTHISLIQEAGKNKVKYKIIYNASVLDAAAETGLQLYKFGKIASMPKWSKSYKPTSFIEIIKDNQQINAHSLILIDIGLELKDAIDQLLEVSKGKINLKKMIVCSRLGNNDKEIVYKNVREIKKNMKPPFCFIIPGKLNFMEKEVLDRF